VLPCPVTSLYCIGSQASPYFSPTSAFKGFLSSKARLAPFSCWARVSEIPLSELGMLSAWEDKRFAERADDALSACMHGRFSSRFFSLAKRVDASLSGCCSLSAYASLSETPAIATFLFFIFSLETEVENPLIHIEGHTYKKNHKLGKRHDFHKAFQHKS